MKKGKLIVISGPSGAGKGSVCNGLLADNTLNLTVSISATTRDLRGEEKDGVNYFFLNRNQFEELIKNDALLEYATVYDNYYGTPKEAVFEKLNNGQNVILEIDVQGALKVKAKYSDALLVFIMPPSLAVLHRRIIDRATDAADKIEKRMSCAKDEIEQSKEYDYVVVNDNLEKAIDEVKNILRRC